MSKARASRRLRDSTASLAGDLAGHTGQGEPTYDEAVRAAAVVGCRAMAIIAKLVLAFPVESKARLAIGTGKRRPLGEESPAHYFAIGKCPPPGTPARAALEAMVAADPGQRRAKAASDINRRWCDAHPEQDEPQVALDWLLGELNRMAQRDYASRRADILARRARAKRERAARKGLTEPLQRPSGPRTDAGASGDSPPPASPKVLDMTGRLFVPDPSIRERRSWRFDWSQ